MAFLYSVIGDNTPDNREWLEKVGYDPLRFFLNGKYIYTKQSVHANSKETWTEPYYEASDEIDDSPKYINCIGNPALFRAVTAISSTTDIGKYYINNHTGRWKRCDYNMATDENIDWGDWTEATLSELQAHFKQLKQNRR